MERIAWDVTAGSQDDGDGGPTTPGAADLELAALRAHDLGDQGQPETEALGSPSGSAAVSLPCRNRPARVDARVGSMPAPWSPVDDVEAHVVANPGGGEGHLRTLRGVGDGVVHQGDNAPAQTGRYGPDDAAAVGGPAETTRPTPRSPAWRHAGEDLPGEVADIHGDGARRRMCELRGAEHGGRAGGAGRVACGLCRGCKKVFSPILVMLGLSGKRRTHPLTLDLAELGTAALLTGPGAPQPPHAQATATGTAPTSRKAG